MLCLLELLYATGLRVSELISLPRSAGTTRERYLVVRGKGGRERLVPISARAHAAVERWRGQLPSDARWLFPSRRTHLSRVRLFQILPSLPRLLFEILSAASGGGSSFLPKLDPLIPHLLVVLGVVDLSAKS